MSSGHLDILSGREGADQVVLLEDETDLAPRGGQHRVGGAVQLLAGHPHAAGLHGAQRAHQCEKGRLARATVAHDDRDLAGREIDIDAVQDLAHECALAVGVAQPAHGDDRLGGGGHRRVTIRRSPRAAPGEACGWQTHRRPRTCRR